MALTATPNFELTLEEQCEAIWAATEERQVEMDAIRAKPPLIRFFDGRGDLQWVVRDDDEFSVDDIVNDTGPGSITFDFDRPVAQYLNDMYGRKKRGESINVLMVIDHCGGRWSGLLDVARFSTRTVRIRNWSRRSSRITSSSSGSNCGRRRTGRPQFRSALPARWAARG